MNIFRRMLRKGLYVIGEDIVWFWSVTYKASGN